MEHFAFITIISLIYLELK